jgi:hypothetical protein
MLVPKTATMKKITARWPKDPTDKIRAIKAVRSIADVNLHDAKNWIETNRVDSISGWVDALRVEEIKELVLVSGGDCVSNTQFDKYRDDIKEIAMKAMLADDTVVAEELLNFINKFS